MFIENNELRHRQFFNKAYFILLFLLVCRLIANYLIPLNDATEARYGEIARKMLETGNWVTLFHDYGVPFWAKPPLSTWLSAFSMRVFGINEFAARLPDLLLSLAVLWLVWDLVKKQSGQLPALATALVLASTVYFFLDAGTVMTDPALLFCTTLATVAFWHAFHYANRTWSYLFFVALGLGLLAKGPLAIVLVGLSIFLWVLWRNEWRNLWQRFPWIQGTLIVLAIALPWYILAERRTPGFLNYFIIGEHFSRFLTPGWTGDKYGFAHHAAKGMIWAYALVGMCPWSLIGLRWLATNTKKIPILCQDDQGWLSYLLLCMMSPLLFFTLASNIIYPYVFPALPGFAMLFVELWRRIQPKIENSKWLFPSSMVSGIAFLAVAVVFQVKPEIIAKTQKPVVAEWLKQSPEPHSNFVYWNTKTEFSAQFYSSGRVKAAHDIGALCKLLSNHLENYLVVDSAEINELPQQLFIRFNPIKEIVIKNSHLFLLRTPVINC